MEEVNVSSADGAKLETLGCSVKSLYVDDGKNAEAALTDALTTSRYDCIMMGPGLRVVPPYFLLSEKLINVVPPACPGLDEAMLQLKTGRYGRSCKASSQLARPALLIRIRTILNCPHMASEKAFSVFRSRAPH